MAQLREVSTVSDWWSSERELIRATIDDLKAYRKTLRRGSAAYYQVGYRVRTWSRYTREIKRITQPILSPDELRKRRAAEKKKTKSTKKKSAGRRTRT